MILLREHGVLFLKPHKVAGTSFEIALSRYAQAGDIVTRLGRRGSKDEALRQALGFTSPRGDGYPLWRLPFLPIGEWRAAIRRRQLPRKFRSHTAAALARHRLSPEEWNGALKVSLVRNPYDAAVSSYYWSRRGSEAIGAFYQRNPHVIARNRHYYLIDGEPVIDHFIRLEHAGEDIAALEAKIPALGGLAETFSGIRAKSGYRPGDVSASELLASVPGLKRRIEQECSFEIARFGYRLEG